ncbi:MULTISPECIES: 2'-deoxycytidine 5'-triphosphate deaminase [Methylosinus]|uniref:2'-deoxycytidine 5'-triphosphate deaminase n=1 Tax=Methylosinus trichosporium (strain ATCC 35070 / NCIMB 11131 / UNIQEM 75 / OB3b) TaxID=595536 RepID=A0A2D2D4T3_METT3|nr:MULTISPECIES: 2'-deoxycytidine 5'-triphosphate deaminase [Methylosinus]ATQ69965.1 2'-deoxycytidine 5'-triphosphate deaminase [Methylosinus trichosporium OB3b]OBS51117.1 2-deoxycytidine 5-triphosphate deaminase [Methylosinus sp. 3S-1]
MADPASFGVLSCEQIAELTAAGAIVSTRPIEDGQRQPASLDLRLGPKAYRVRASFLPGKGRSVEALLAELSYDEIALGGRGAVLERGCVYVIPLQESLALPADVAAVANPKSSTGRLDIFTRLITDDTEIFDHVAAGYEGRLYAEVSPRSFSVRVHEGSRLDQMRFRRRGAADLLLADAALAAEHARAPLVDGDLTLRDGVILRVALDGLAGDVVGYRAQKHADVIDVDLVDHYAIEDYWERLPLRASRKLILDPDEFYILASRERLRIPAHLSAEMMAIDPAMGEFRVHYAGFFDPGFGCAAQGRPGSRAVLEVRSHDVPFILEDGQVIGRLVYEPMSAEPKLVYGEVGGSNYQGQDLKLSKHFKAP